MPCAWLKERHSSNVREYHSGWAIVTNAPASIALWTKRGAVSFSSAHLKSNGKPFATICQSPSLTYFLPKQWSSADGIVIKSFWLRCFVSNTVSAANFVSFHKWSERHVKS